MYRRFYHIFGRYALYGGALALFTLSLIACTMAPAPPIIVSTITGGAARDGMPGAGTSSHRIEAVFNGTVRAGDNEVTIKVYEAATGAPLRGATVRVTVEQSSHTDSHAAPETSKPADGETADHTATQADHHDAAAATNPAVAAIDKPEHGETASHERTATSSHDDSEPTTNHPEAHAGDDQSVLAAGATAGEYHGKVNFPTAGEWRIIVRFAPDGHAQEAALIVTAARSRGQLAVLGGFLSVNLAIVGLAAITKPKGVKGQARQETMA